MHFIYNLLFLLAGMYLLLTFLAFYTYHIANTFIFSFRTISGISKFDRRTSTGAIGCDIRDIVNFTYLHLQGETSSTWWKFLVEQRCVDQGLDLLSSGQELLHCEYLELVIRHFIRARENLASELIELVRDNESTRPKIKANNSPVKEFYKEEHNKCLIL